MQRLKMQKQSLTFGECCELYIQDCKARNLRAATIKHYKSSYKQMFNYFSADMPIDEFTVDNYNQYVIYLKSNLINDMSINAYLRDLITTLHFLMNNGYMQEFQMRIIKTDKPAKETYTDEELAILLKKPNINKCSYIEYECWVISCLLMSTGIRQHSLMELKIKDIDFVNSFLNVRVTKTRKPLIIPLNQTMINILREFLRYRQHNNIEDWLFCNVYGNKLTKSTSYHMIYEYNHKRGVATTGLHRYRHTFAKHWILKGGSVVTLSKLLGHSNLNTTQNYINLLVSDISDQVNEIDLLNQFSNKKYIKMK